MNTTRTLLLAALGGFTILGFSPQPVPAGPVPGPTHSILTAGLSLWPPKPANIVNLIGDSGGALAPGTSHQIYSVPDGSWLVVTNVLFNGPFAELIEDDGVSPKVKLPQSFDATPTSGNPMPYNASGVGLTFAPNSKVLVKNPHTTASIEEKWVVTG